MDEEVAREGTQWSESPAKDTRSDAGVEKEDECGRKKKKEVGLQW